VEKRGGWGGVGGLGALHYTSDVKGRHDFICVCVAIDYLEPRAAGEGSYTCVHHLG